jgi:Rps23 Pro-64 3,4-dihydroxylase Tpa1-like proline 4-hydroxylase
MDQMTDIFNRDIFKDATEFNLSKPIPMGVIDEFLPKSIALSMHEESQIIPQEHWKTFTRNGSHMMELNKMELTPVAFNTLNYLHSSKFLELLSKYTGITGLIPDPHLVGAGYSKSFNGDILNVHTDFNWNEQLQLHRALTLTIYLTPDWNEAWNGALDFYDSKKENIVTTVDSLFNRCLIWKYDRFGYHGYSNPIECPDDKNRTTFRAFYYTSNSTHLPDDPPHRSLYWVDKITNMPCDKRTQQ